MKLAGKTDVGSVRPENQDDYRAGELNSDAAWGLVCDGMGGARGGREASVSACDVIEHSFHEQYAQCLPGDEETFLKRALINANRFVFQKASREEELAGMGTTAVCALVRGGNAFICHAGDSRAYLVRGGRLTQLTHDHSYVQELVDCGTITAEEAEHHPQKNIITRALGVDYRLDPEFTSVGAGYLWYISPNMDAVPELANLNLRRAITFALDRDSITNDVLKDGSSPAYTAVPAQFATGPDGSDFSADQTKFAEFCAYDPDKAAEYYEQAKAELGKDSFSFTMVVDADDAPQKVAQVVQEQLQTTLPGFTLELKVEPKKQRVQDMQDGNFEIGLTRWGPDYADPMTYLGMWVTGNSNNYGLWSDADYDAVIAECTTGDLCTDPEGRWEAMYDAESIVLEQAAIFPLYGQCNAEMISSAVTGVDFHPVALNRVFKDAKKSV